MDFSFQHLKHELFTTLQNRGHHTPTEIQLKTIPLLMGAPTDFVGQAQTGTGKTAAFCLPLLHNLDFTKNGISAMILAPTRELALQIYQEIEQCKGTLPVKAITVYGGVGYREQLDGIRNAHIVIATPGRAKDLITRGKLPLNNCTTFIIDEADEMLKMGFIDDVEFIMSEIAANAHTWMFSATLPAPITRLIEKKLKRPQMVRIAQTENSAKNIEQSYLPIAKSSYLTALKGILLTEPSFYGIIFCETKEDTKNCGESISQLGLPFALLHGDLNQTQRNLSMDQFRNRQVQILICTDVAARGLDVPHVTHVINLGLPRTSESYVHRIGRTGRAGQSGKAITFLSPKDLGKISIIERITKQSLQLFQFPSFQAAKTQCVLNQLATLPADAAQLPSSSPAGLSEFQQHFATLSRQQLESLMFHHLFHHLDTPLKGACQLFVSGRSKPTSFSTAPRSRSESRKPRYRHR